MRCQEICCFCCAVKHVWLFVIPWTAICQVSLSSTISQSLLNLISIDVVIPSNHLILCYPLLLQPSIFLSISVFSSKSALHIRWPKYWSYSFSTSHQNGYPGLITFRIGWFDLLAVQGTLKSLPQHHSYSHISQVCLLSKIVVENNLKIYLRRRN